MLQFSPSDGENIRGIRGIRDPSNVFWQNPYELYRIKLHTKRHHFGAIILANVMHRHFRFLVVATFPVNYEF